MMAEKGSRRQALSDLVGAEGVTLVSPPILMPADVFFDLAGEEFARRLILTVASDSTEYCLRPEFTLPIARSYLADGARGARAFGYIGPIFRQRESGPAEFEQAGLELIDNPDPQDALRQVFGFARSALGLYDVARPAVRLGSVDLFEALLAAADIPAVWRPRLRHRFGNPEAMQRLLERLADPHAHAGRGLVLSRDELIERITGQMVEAGLSLTSSRTPGEIADRYLEQQALAAARVPADTLELLHDYLAISGEARGALARIEKRALASGVDIANQLQVMERRIGLIEEAGPVSGLVFDANFSPRLDYYTGIVFEVRGPGDEVLVSGGEYDLLLERLGASGEIPAAGCAVWVERLEREARS